VPRVRRARAVARARRHSARIVPSAVVVARRAPSRASRARDAPAASRARPRAMRGATVTIAPGVEMPTLAFGTFKLRGDACRDAVRDALLHGGFRAVDTASCYGNEDAVAAALACAPKTIAARTFVTTKISPDEMRDAATTNRAIDAMLARLGRAPDLLLVHWPGRSKAPPESDAHADARKRTWRCMERALRQQKCRAIGASNYEISHMRELMSYCVVPPAVNQIEVHPAYPNAELRAYCASLAPRVVVVAYAPLGGGALLDHPRVRAFADAIGLAPAPALVRWALHRDCAVVVKSSARCARRAKRHRPRRYRRRRARASRRRARRRVRARAGQILLGSARRAMIDAAPPPPRARDRGFRRARRRGARKPSRDAADRSLTTSRGATRRDADASTRTRPIERAPDRTRARWRTPSTPNRRSMRSIRR